MGRKTELEIQLGHMCNNRCVFCVSGQQTARGRALPMLDPDPVYQHLEAGFASGHRKLTLLGGEPTLQPGFLNVVEHAVRLGFEEIVIFTNGVKTARRSFVEDVLRLGGQFTWRLSFQGATKEAHERTTGKPGSFDRLVASLEHLHALDQKITVNMCVVRSNFASVPAFPALLLRYGVVQLHLDMVRPSDAGERTDEEFAAMLPRYSDLAAPLRAMIAGFPEGFDVNIGNLPYCIAPDLAPWIHHDGQPTLTVAVDGQNQWSVPWDKYAVKRQDKRQASTCERCLFAPRCSGIFDRYRALYGEDELSAIDGPRLAAVDPERRFAALHFEKAVASLTSFAPPAPFTGIRSQALSDREVQIELSGAAPLVLSLRAEGPGAARCDAFTMVLHRVPADAAAGLRALWGLWEHWRPLRGRVVHPPGLDAFRGQLAPALLRRIARLRQKAPFGELEWRRLSVSAGGRRAALSLSDPAGEEVSFWLEESTGGVRAGYALSQDPPSAQVLSGLRAIARALDAGSPRPGLAGEA